MSLNRAKESIALDLKLPRDRRIFEQLLAGADVLVENFRPGAMARLGYGWPELHARYPRLICAATSGFGQTGPDAERPAYDITVQGLGGLMSLTGHVGGPPTRVGTSLGDITAGLFTTIGICAALYERGHGGEGARIDVAMLDCQIAILENAIALYVATGEVPGPAGARHPSIAPFECYASADGHIIIAAGNDALFDTLCTAIDRRDIAEEPRFASNAGRSENVESLKHAIESTLTTHGTCHWLAVLEAAGVPCAPVNNVAEAINNPQIRARNMIATIDDPEAGRFQVAGNPIKFAHHPDPTLRSRAPALDEHRHNIIAGLPKPPSRNPA